MRNVKILLTLHKGKIKDLKNKKQNYTLTLPIDSPSIKRYSFYSMEGWRSGQSQQTVNLPSLLYVGSNPAPSTTHHIDYTNSCYTFRRVFTLKQARSNNMNIKRLILASLAVFGFIFIYEFITHGILLKDLYTQTAHIWRPQEDCNMLFMLGSQILFSIAFTFLFTQKYENKGINEGAKYGVFVAYIIGAVKLGTYVYLPIPMTLTFYWVAIEIVKCIGAGTIAALVYKK